jgi:hypothetical protein
MPSVRERERWWFVERQGAVEVLTMPSAADGSEMAEYEQQEPQISEPSQPQTSPTPSP